LPYDYLVLATGSRYAPPIKDPEVVMASRAKDLATQAHRVADARSVLIIGGGLAGVELAAEIVAAYPGKEVSIVDGGPQLLGRVNASARSYATAWLRRRGVQLQFNQRIERRDGDAYVTESGSRLAADVAFVCTGVVPNGELAGAAFPGCLDERGFVRVQPTLQLPGHPNVFAVGDVNDCGVEKTAQNARRQAAVAAANVVALSSGRGLAEYQPVATPMVISLGPRDGIFVSGKGTVTGWLPAAMKWGVERQVC
jgi:NADH dehydrogenase FAD-containing subunit